MNQFDYIAIEGVIGAGKTTLAELLAERHQGRLVREQFEENPFLPKFYEDRQRYAFQTQLAFLASRFKQQQALSSKDLFHQMVISDYLFEKDRIFARLNLNEDELGLYDTIYNIMTGIAVKPDLIIFLQSSVESLMKNIKKRGREYEKQISEEYLYELNEAYNHFFYHYNKTPLIIINSSDIQFDQRPDYLEYVEEQIFHQPIRSNTHIHIISD
ncbi:MAG: deoxynucleoside kinase [Balneolaceae bacterium]